MEHIQCESRSRLKKLPRRHRSDFLPILKDASASRRRRKVCRTWATRRTPTGALLGEVNNFVDAAGQFTCIRPAFCNYVHLFGSSVGIHGEAPRRMRANAAGFWKSECIVIGNQDCISRHACGYRLPVVHSASQLPGSRQQLVISLSGGRLRRRAAFTQPPLNIATAAMARIDVALITRSFCIGHPACRVRLSEDPGDPRCLVRKFFANKLIGAKPRRSEVNRCRAA
jgi:hypothetical protein